MAHRPYRPKDHFFQKAKGQGLRARSAFKIEEISRRFRLFAAGDAVLDLGAAPGGFLQIIAEAVGEKGSVVGVDVAPIRPLGPVVKTLVLDVLDPGAEAAIAAVHAGPFDAVISDLAPKTTGVRATDEARSLALAGRALELASRRGRPGGHFVAKLFMGGGFEAFRGEVASQHREVKIVRPEATRGASIEVYVVGLSRRP